MRTVRAQVVPRTMESSTRITRLPSTTDLMAESFSFVAAVRTFLRGRFSEAEQNAVLHLAFKLLEMADQVVPKIYDTTPEGGREALLAVRAMLNDTGDWTQRLSPEERKLYEKLSEFL